MTLLTYLLLLTVNWILWIKPDVVTNVGKEDALRFQVDGLPMTTVVEEVF